MSFVAQEIASQPACWRRVPDVLAEHVALMPRPGQRVAVVGCGTSWFVAQAYAALREGHGHGETDAFAASETPRHRAYDLVLAITRSGTTTEVLELLGDLSGHTPTLAITAGSNTQVRKVADDTIVLGFADECSVVQTRFATTALALLRAHMGEDLSRAAADAEQVLADPLPSGLVSAEQFTFLGTGWTCGLAQEAALKMREAAGTWTEAYPAMEYRHGPISITGPGRVTWMFGAVPNGLSDEVLTTGGLFRDCAVDPMAELVRVQRLAVAVAESRGRDPDHPRHLSRSVVLD